MPLRFDYLALPPEVNSFRLTTGPGAGPMLDTAAAYERLAAGLLAAAGGSDGAMNSMAATWQGPSADLAQAAFRKHAGWLREQAGVAAQTATLTTAAAGAFATAYAAMPKLPEIIANRLAVAGLTVVSNTPMGAPAKLMIAALELDYLRMRIQAGVTMIMYAEVTTNLLSALPPPVAPPPITSDGGAADSPVAKNYDHLIPKDNVTQVGDRSLTDTNTKPTDTGTGDKPGETGTDTGKTTPDPTDPTSNPTQPAEQAVSDMDRTISSLSDTMTNPSADGSSPLEHGFYGTTPYSTTLSGLNGGVGSMVALGMLRGGLGSMPGASTGFRMPSNWSLGRGTAFGAPANTTTAGPASRNTPPRGASAPKAQMRRRRDEDRDKSKVFVPGEPQDVPVLEQPPVIGVIEYADDERPEETADEQLVLAGVLQSSDDDPAPIVENVPGDAHRGRV
ncbi:PPE family protein [Nocardia sp. NBC_00881]|uniref:PPE family protein n=1 Tax=Nocardia sp. NBC_00881 TaxID=2975995 RepID=UPI00386B1197|nr:PPE family protein [Nocardia sp. NBC_00881]